LGRRKKAAISTGFQDGAPGWENFPPMTGWMSNLIPKGPKKKKKVGAKEERSRGEKEKLGE